jgi:aminomethyltransferase
MKNTPLTDIHISLGAKMAPFAGYNMPIQYSGIVDEHLCVRNAVGIFDVSHMGEFVLKGNKALDLLQRVVSNDVAALEKGKALYGYLPNDKGGIVDDLLIYHLDDGNYMCVVNASNIEKDWNWIQAHNTENVEMHNISDKTVLLAIQGPKAADALQSLTDVELSEIPYYCFKRGKFAGVENVIISATGYTGAGGFELYFNAIHAVDVWHKILQSGEVLGIKPAGLGCRDTLRLEMGYCLYGNDIDDTTSPLEAGLGWVTKWNKDFVAKEILQAQKQQTLTKKLSALKMIDKAIPRHGYRIIDADGNEIGIVTSGTQSPVLATGIALAYINVPYYKIGSRVFVEVRGKSMAAEVVKAPFV